MNSFSRTVFITIIKNAEICYYFTIILNIHIQSSILKDNSAVFKEREPIVLVQPKNKQFCGIKAWIFIALNYRLDVLDLE